MSQTKISCLKCRSLWIAIAIGAIAVLLIGIAVFDFKIYSDNIYYIQDGLRYSILFLTIPLFGYSAYYNIRKFCSKPYTVEHGGSGGSIENLAWGIGSAVIVIALIMILYSFMPMTIQEWQVRSDDYSIESILKLDCKTLISNKDYNGSMGYFYVLDDHGIGGTDISKKFKECGLY